MVTQPAPRTLTPLVVGHLAVAAGVVILTGLILRDTFTHLLEPSAGVRLLGLPPITLLIFGLGVLGLAQLLAVHRLAVHRRALAGVPWHPSTVLALTFTMERIELSMALALFPLLCGAVPLSIDPPPAPLLALCLVLPCVSLLLDQAHAGRVHRDLDGCGPRFRTLPSGSGARVRRKMLGRWILLVGIAAVAVLLAVAGAVRAVATAAPLTGLLAVVGAGAAAASALLLTGPVRRMRESIRDDAVDQSELDHAAGAVRRFGPSGALGPALLAPAIAAGSAGPRLGLAMSVLFALALGVTSVQLSQAVRVRLGVPLGIGDRRIGGTRAR